MVAYMTGVTVLHFLEGFTILWAPLQVISGVFFILNRERKPSDLKVWYLDVCKEAPPAL